jgi:hypothetical protein
MFDVTSADQTSHCQVTVSGASSGKFPLRPGLCPNRRFDGSDPLDAGTFEYSTFAESGTITFTVTAFAGVGQDPACKVGEGSTAVSVGAMKSTTGAVPGEVKIQKAATPPAFSCTNVTQPMDASVDL